MRRSFVALALSLALASGARAQSPPPPSPDVAPPAAPAIVPVAPQVIAPPAHGDSHARQAEDDRRASRHKKIGLGLLIGAGVFAVLGIVFVALAKNANDNALAGNRYHPSSEDERDRYQVTHATMFTIAGVAFAGGLVLTLDR